MIARSKVLSVTLALAAMVCAVAPRAARAQDYYDPRLKVGARPLAFKAKDLKGKPVVLSAYKGKVVLLDFWATWCGPCREEMPNVKQVYKKYHAKGLEIVGVSLDEDKTALKQFLATNKMTWRQIFDGKGWDNEVSNVYGVHSIPFMLLIGKDGKIAAVDAGGEALAPAVKRALAK